MEYIEGLFDKAKRVPIKRAMQMLGLKMKRDGSGFRSSCPVCGGDDRTLVITPAEEIWHCQKSTNPKDDGGDVIALVAHINQSRQAKAAIWLLEQIGEHPVTVPEKKPEKGTKSAAKSAEIQPLSSNEDVERAIKSLIHEHPKVQALGLSVQHADDLDIGFKPRGLYKGRVCGPARTRDGHAVCLEPLAEDFQFPKTLHWPASNVVPLKPKQRA